MSDASLEMMLKAVETAGRGRAKAAAVQGFIHDEDFRWYWLNALSPYIHFNLTLTMRDLPVSGLLTSPSDELVELLDKIQSGQVSGSQAKRQLKTVLASHTMGLQRFLVGMINKEPRLGISIGGIQAADPGLVPVFQLPLAPAKEIEWHKVIYPCLVSPKIDGLRCVYENGVLRSRGGNEFQGLTWLQKAVQVFQDKEPRLIRLDGEITAQGQHFDEISGKLRSFQETHDAHYNIFDMVVDFDEPLEARIRRLHELTVAVQQEAGQQPDGWTYVPNYLCKGRDDVTRVYMENLNDGYEGVMVKDAKSVYFTGRKADWQKLKPSHTIDLTVTGVNYGSAESTIAGQVAALVCKGAGFEVTVGSGLSDSQRRTWSESPDLIVGKTIEVKFMERSSQGSLRHPRLIQVRGDK